MVILMSEKTKEEVELENKEKEEEEDNKSIWSYFPYLLLMIILLFFSVFSITYSIYKGDLDDNEITTDHILFTYSDVDKAGNGIYLKNAIPISDRQGKLMVGNRQYFDFHVTATTKRTDLEYRILLEKDHISTLQNHNVRIYLTQVYGEHEKVIRLCDFSDLKVKQINNKKYYVLYQKDLDSPLDNYTDSYRLRMWVKQGAIGYESKIFSVKVDVFAEQEEE